MRNFKDLKVWGKSHELAVSLYKATQAFPKEEVYGLTAQIRRACSSIPANIAEGCGRMGEAELARFFNIALGSASELEYHLLLSKDLGYLSFSEHEAYLAQVCEIKRMLTRFIQKLTADR